MSNDQRDDVDLTEAEVNRICEGITQNAAKIRFLRNSMKLIVRESASGKPLVNRQHYNETGCGRELAPGEPQRGPAANEPAPARANIVGLSAWSQGRANGKKAS